MAFLYEINSNIAEVRYQGQKYWIDQSSNLKINWARDSDYIIEIKSDGSYEYRKNRRDGSKEVLPQDGSYDWITVQILSSKPIPKRIWPEGTAWYAPYVPLTVTSASPGIEPTIKFRTRYNINDNS